MKKEQFHFSQIFNIKNEEDDLDFFDINLKYDTPLFIDPFLIKRSSVEEERGLFDRFGLYFEKAYKISLSIDNNDEQIKKLKRFFTFNEPEEIYLGYTLRSNKGKGPAGKLADALFDFFEKKTLSKIFIDKDIYPDKKINLSLFSALSNNVDLDGISDLSAAIILDYLIKYTQNVCKKYNIKTQSLPVRDWFDFDEMEWSGGGYNNLPKNPFNGQAIILVPKRFLRSCGIINNKNFKSNIVSILRNDDEAKIKFSNFLDKKIDEITIDDIYGAITEDQNIIKKYLELIEKGKFDQYNFSKDPLQFLSIKENEIFFDGIKAEDVKNDDGLMKLVLEFTDIFEHAIVYKGHFVDMWNNDRHCSEQTFGRKLHGMAIAFFSHYKDIMVDMEVKSGIGFIDFRISRGETKIAIEIKNLCNDSYAGKPPIKTYIHGLVRQLPLYVKEQRAQYAIYLTGQHFKANLDKKRDDTYRINEINEHLKEVKDDLLSFNKDFVDIVYRNIDLSVQPSPSKC